jgi:hypothetical protein
LLLNLDQLLRQSQLFPIKLEKIDKLFHLVALGQFLDKIDALQFRVVFVAGLSQLFDSAV